MASGLPPCAHVLGKVLQRGVIAARGGKQQTLGFKVMHDGDVRVPALDAGLVDPDVAHARHIVPGTGDLDVMAHPTPQALGATRNWLAAWRTGISGTATGSVPRTAR